MRLKRKIRLKEQLDVFYDQRLIDNHADVLVQHEQDITKLTDDLAALTEKVNNIKSA